MRVLLFLFLHYSGVGWGIYLCFHALYLIPDSPTNLILIAIYHVVPISSFILLWYCALVPPCSFHLSLKSIIPMPPYDYILLFSVSPFLTLISSMRKKYNNTEMLNLQFRF